MFLKLEQWTSFKSLSDAFYSVSDPLASWRDYILLFFLYIWKVLMQRDYSISGPEHLASLKENLQLVHQERLLTARIKSKTLTNSTTPVDTTFYYISTVAKSWNDYIDSGFGCEVGVDEKLGITLLKRERSWEELLSKLVGRVQTSRNRKTRRQWGGRKTTRVWHWQ